MKKYKFFNFLLPFVGVVSLILLLHWQKAPAQSSSIHLTMGNPSGAVTSTSYPNNYLLSKSQYALSYNNTTRIPNWVSWQLNKNWLGSAPRQDDFRADTSLPSSWYQVQGTDYQGSGFDRGHMTPSADRTNTVTNNSATFLMTNMIPQAPDNNQGPWANLETYCRDLVVNQGKELYIISGGYGSGGTGSNGTRYTIANGNIQVPARTWKVIVVLDTPGSGASGVTTNTRVIAVDMPNSQGIRSDNWKTYRVSVDSIESNTGYNFLSNVSTSIQSVIEARIDNL
ncbi:DNA/RNA non-specific endonuclease [Nostoc ellipsosporum NOK]|nr:DNA/RNA non-specific endonuclease [Nostoc ellipsosporum NOK]